MKSNGKKMEINEKFSRRKSDEIVESGFILNKLFIIKSTG